MKKKNTIAMALVGALLLPTNVLAASPTDFSDFPSDWSTAAMTQAVQNGLLNGTNGKILPGGLLTRAELATMMNRAFGASAAASLAGYTDVQSGAWYYGEMAKAVQMGTFQGADGKLNPSTPVTREEAFTVLARAFALTDGKESALEVFSDASSVASWAKGSMAALVEGGYVQGADGKLNPKKNMTRAEFAQVITKMATVYLDENVEAGKTLTGNVMVRKSGVVLDGLTIDGDLILADSVDSASLKNVKVTGRIVIRGGVQQIEANECQASGVLVSNPNGTAKISASGGKLGTVQVKSDLNVKGTLDSVSVIGKAKVTVEADGQIDQVIVGANGAQITGAGKVNKVSANANDVTVTNPGAQVTAGSNTTGVKAGDKAVAAGKTETVSATSGGSSSGGSSGGASSSGGSSGGSHSGGGSSSGGQVTQAAIVDNAQAKVITTDAGSYLPLVFQTGFQLENTKVTVDGVDVTQYITKVTENGSIAKLPLIAKPGVVKLECGGKTQTITLGTAPTGGSVYTGDDYLPDYFLAHGPLAMWDYYLTNYDNAGNPRVLPSRTTFSTTAAKNEHPSYSADTVLDANGKGTAVVMFNYTKEADKAWFDNIAEYDETAQTGSVQLVSYDQYKNVWNYNLSFTKGTADHNGSTVATLSIPVGQSNFTNNQRYYIRVCSTDPETGVKSYTLAPIHVVQQTPPTLSVKETPESGRNLHFAVKNMVYGITSPIEKVTLTDPSGKTEELTYIDDYFLFSQDLFVLYNDVNAENGTNHLAQPGNYTITIQANGFKTFSCKFNVADDGTTQKPVVAQTASRNAGIDVLSGATGGGSSSGGDSSSGGYAISADLLFDGDLLANALVLEKVGQETPEAAVVLDYWKSNTISDAAFDVGDTAYFAFSDYISAVNTAQTEGKLYLPFGEYRKNAQATVNPPHATKAVLEDGLLGDIQDSSLSGKLDTPAYTVSGKQGEDAVLTFTGDNAAEYLSKINGLYFNGDWRELTESAYTIDTEAKTITLKARYLSVGENTLKIQSSGYKPLTAKVNYAKVNETGLSLDVTAEENKLVHIAVQNSEGDFLDNLSGITLTKDGETDTVWSKDTEGGDAVYYVVADDKKSVDLYNVTPGEYEVSIQAQYYDALTATFTVAGEVKVKDAPDMTMSGSLTDNKLYRLEFDAKKNADDEYITTVRDVAAWVSAVKTVTVNGTEYSPYTGMIGSPAESQYQWTYSSGTEKPILLNSSAFTEDVNTVVITAKGYQPLTLKVNKDGSLAGSSDPTPSVAVPTTAPTIENIVPYCKLTFADNKEWVGKISSIQVGEDTYTEETAVVNIQSKKFVRDAENGIVYVQFPSSWGETRIYTMVISAEGCEDVILKVTIPYYGNPTIEIQGDNGSETPDQPSTPTTVTVPTTDPKMEKGSDSHIMTFADSKEWIEKINKIKVEDAEYTEVASVYNVREGNFFRDAENNKLYVTFPSVTFGETGNYTMVISAEGCEDITLKITIPSGIFSTPTAVIQK